MSSPDLAAQALSLDLPGLFGIAFAEKFIPVVPSYVLLMLLGMTAPDEAALVATLVATAAGSLAGSLAWYLVGRGLGEHRVEAVAARFGRFVLLPPRTYGRLAATYRRNRFWVTMVGQTVPVARIYLALPAGVLRLPPASFALAAALGILAWNTPFVALGYALRGSTRDPVDIGIWAALALIATEAGVIVGARLLARLRRGPRDGERPMPDGRVERGTSSSGDGAVASGVPPRGQAPLRTEPLALCSLGRNGSLEVRLAATRSEVRRAQRLRYEVFYEEMSAVPGCLGLLTRRDVDAYDAVCDHLLVIDHAAEPPHRTPKVVGTYRLLRGEVAARNAGFYSEREYDLGPLLATHGHQGLLELGRGCVRKAYRTGRTVELLWQGIYAYALHHRSNVLIGCASLEGTDPDQLARPLAFLYHHARAPAAWRASALPGRAVAMDRLPREEVDAREASRALSPLIKGYLRLGATFSDEAVIDPRFRTTDVFVTLSLESVGARYRTHFAPTV